uniref:Uncharacterized protein n=1 Tax=Salix viminalis TaxID=40686 RepID=A0A6N2KIH7_SALVM
MYQINNIKGLRRIFASTIKPCLVDIYQTRSVILKTETKSLTATALKNKNPSNPQVLSLENIQIVHQR